MANVANGKEEAKEPIALEQEEKNASPKMTDKDERQDGNSTSNQATTEVLVEARNSGLTTKDSGSPQGLSHAELMRKHDLTEKMTQYWDPHMIVVVLKWLKAKKRYPDSELNPVMVKVLSQTYLSQDWQYSHGERAKEHAEKQELEDYIADFVKCMTEARSQIQAYQNKVEPSRTEQSRVDQPKADLPPFTARQSYKDWTTWYKRERLGLGEITPGTTVVIPEDSGTKFLEYCKLAYLLGDYERASRWLNFFNDFICEWTPEGLNFERKQSALWGLLTSLILLLPNPPVVPPGSTVSADGHYAGDSFHQTAAEPPPTTAVQEEDANKLASLILKLDDLLEENNASMMVLPVSLNESIDGAGTSLLSRGATPMSAVAALSHNKRYKDVLLIRRTWLLHWAVWPVFRYYLPRLLLGGRACFARHTVWQDLLEWIFRERNLGTVLLTAPHLLRYVSVLAILNDSREDHFQLVCQTISAASQSQRFSDPFTSLLEALFVEFDFDRAQKTLSECSLAAEADFFLAPLQSAIEEAARLILFETYCRIHKSINIDMIAEKLNMTATAAEKWIVNLIRHAKLDAKIDSERNRVEITTEPPNIYQQVVETTRNVVSRSNLLIQNLEKPNTTDRGDFDQRRRGFGYRGALGGAGFARSGGGRTRN